jgi:DNA-binding NarL/FixJ family response regulator
MAFRVVIAEDQLVVREGLQRILEMSDEIDLVGIVGDGDALLEAVERVRPDVVLIDARMLTPDEGEGIRLANELGTRFPEIAVLALSHDADPAHARAFFREGASGRGYLLQEHLMAPRELLDAIVEVAGGRSVVDPEIIDALVSLRSRAASSPLRSLSVREREVLAEIAGGKSNAAIGRSLEITRRAVERHVTSIFSKLDLPSEENVSRRVQATLLYLADRDSP